MQTVFLRSNLYQALPVLYGDLGVFGTSAMLIEEDIHDVIRCFPLPIGSYSIGVNEKLQVDAFARDFTMTVRQLVKKFGMQPNGEIDWTNISASTKQAWEMGNFENRVEVSHMIIPNELYDPKQLSAKMRFPFASCYWEKGSGSNSGDPARDKFLSEKGYTFFPVLVPRWEVTGEDAWGSECPGMVAIGDARQLQLMEKRAAQAIEKKVSPPMVGPTSLKGMKASILPGDITFHDETNDKKFRPAHEVNLSLAELENKMDQIRRRIQRAFFEDLFLMLANDDRSNITAREIDERHEEKLLALGPVLEQLNQDLLDPLIDIAFDIMMSQRLLPEIPNELRGLDLKVEYISVMAQAQKLVGISSMERFATFTTNLMAVSPEVGDKANFDEMVDVYGDMTSVAPKVIRSDEEVAQIRQSRAAAAQKQAQMEQMQATTASVKNLSQASLDRDNALGRMVDMAEAGDLTGETA
jgi:hypothetical protein